jgi:hypothetical protein
MSQSTKKERWLYKKGKLQRAKDTTIKIMNRRHHKKDIKMIDCKEVLQQCTKNSPKLNKKIT